LSATIAQLRRYNFSPAVLDGLYTYLSAAPLTHLEQIQVGSLRRALHLDEPAALDLLIAAVHEGLLDLHWAARCVHCGDVNTEWDHLQAAHSTTFCAGCEAHSPTQLDRNLHVRFALNPHYRPDSLPAAGDPAPASAVAPVPGEESFPDAAPLTGIELLNVQAFRDLLVEQVLPPSESLAVTRIALLFSDLRGSTAMYARKGDPVAYRLVREHYDLILRNVVAQQGAVVKTVGDGVMASFTSAVAAVRAALDIQHELAHFNQEHGLSGADSLQLKLGIHAGPCLCVNLSGRLDYFGTTVNIAARVESLSEGQDVVATAAVFREAGVAQVLADLHDRDLRTSEFTAGLRGIDEPVQVTRITLPSPAAAPVGVAAG
jgi:class 3 adenylate cyclase